MRVDGREIRVAGSLLQPPQRRTNDILRLILAAAFLASVITGSLITRPRWIRLEKSISSIVGVLSIRDIPVLELGRMAAELVWLVVICSVPEPVALAVTPMVGGLKMHPA